MIHLITGAARAGKSRFALTLAEKIYGPIDFVATARALDADMEQRIAHHKLERGPRYRTVEAPIAVSEAIKALPSGGAIVLDCLTMWVANLLFSELDDAALNAAFDQLTETLAASPRQILVVTNEVGWGIVPADALSRRYRDQLGRCNQRIAAKSHRVSLLVAGVPMTVK